MHTVMTVIAVIVAVWITGSVIQSWREGGAVATRREEARRRDLEEESASGLPAPELGSAADTQRYAGAWSSEEPTESEPMPTPKPLSPWLDESQ